MKKYLWAIPVILFLGYYSIDIKKLNEVKAVANQQFDAGAYARDFLTKSLPMSYSNAIEVNDLVTSLQANKTKTFDESSHAVSIGNIRNFLVKGSGQVIKINEDEVMVIVKNGSRVATIRLATEFIYGNAIRDAAGLFDIKQFSNNNDINNIASEINKTVRSSVVAALKKNIKVGDTVRFIGALEMNQEHIKLNDLEILPIKYDIIRVISD
jgi:predicted lipoprotein